MTMRSVPSVISENIEEREPVSTMGELAYRYLDCGAEFDGSGAWINP